ncbi:MAG: hypothetical protein A2075_13300 [Geobacteraceae bacterium GWC2_58_44]|nr:MAG: hypothetical protein A2075_13300 [Geobacteraceae bacterium GWC2_58_44]
MVKKMMVTCLMGLMLLAQLFGAGGAEAACAKVSLEIPQSLTMERVAFDAKLVLNNGIPDAALENLRLDIVVRDESGSLQDSRFYVRKPVLSGVNALDGTGTVAAGGRAEAHWLIIPSPGAGVVKENGVATRIGVDYWVGAILSYSILGKEETVAILPEKITVNPMPELVLDYFIPYQVIGDNPFTPQVEPPVAYPLGLRVLNDGYGPALKLKIDSAQPRIVKNDQGLLIDFKLLGASVNDGVVEPSLTVNFGNLASSQAATASWQMISTLTGRFIEFKAAFSHASDLGGELTSLIRETNAHHLTRMVKVNLPGRDSLLDFLAHSDTTDQDEEHLPDAIFESEIPNASGKLADARSPVSVLSPVALPGRPTAEAPSVTLSLPTGQTGWIYTRVPDPAQGLLKLVGVQRSDGVRLDPHNFWVDQGVDEDFNKSWLLQLVDFRIDAAVPGDYTVSYENPAVDTTPPSSQIVFDGPHSGTSPTYLTPQTRIVLTAADNPGGSGVEAMFKKSSPGEERFVPAYPFNLEQGGSYTVQYYSADRAGNLEAGKSASVVVVTAPPTISAFSVTPGSFSPQAPKEVATSRAVQFSLAATSVSATLPVEIAIAAGSSFQPGQIRRTLKGTATAGTPLQLSWDGRDGAGKVVPPGSYTARLKVSDGLDNSVDPAAPIHTATAEIRVSVTDWFTAAPVDANPDADQLHPRVSGSRVVWQDRRNGVWDIYLKDLSGAPAVPAGKLSSGAVDHERPAIDGSLVVWQERRSGGWEIHGYDLATQKEVAVSTGSGDKERPAVAGDWVAWQDRRNGNWDIFARNISTLETLQITSHERDQLHPALSGSTVLWEDYRHGPGEIYSFDLVSRSEQRVTLDPANQSQPAGSNGTVVWTDERDGRREIYRRDPLRGASRMSYGSGDHTQPALQDDLLVYSDFEAGPDDPNLSYRIISSGMGGRLSNDPARQEEAAIGTGVVLWQDNRSGKYQIYHAPFATESLPIAAEIRPGFNLVAVGADLAGRFPTAAGLVAAKGEELGIDRVLSLDPLHNSYTLANAAGGDFPLSRGMGLVIYAGKAGSLTLAGSGETAGYNLVPGSNQIGILSVPYGYSAHDLMRSIGLDHVQSVRRFDTLTGLWQTVALRATETGSELVGLNFAILPGDGVQLFMKDRVDGWAP